MDKYLQNKLNAYMQSEIASGFTAGMEPAGRDSPETVKSRWLGRACRMEFLLAGIGCNIALLAVVFHMSPEPAIGMPTFAFIGIVMIVESIRRLHDMGLSGWFIFFLVFPFMPLLLLFGKGETGPNKYGPDPLRSKGVLQ